MGAKRTLYSVLGVATDADVGAIREAERARAEQEQDPEELKLIRMAASILCDATLRARYDAHSGVGRAETASALPPPAPASEAKPASLPVTLPGSAATAAECPYCKEEIKPQAIRCKHCGATLGGGMEANGRLTLLLAVPFLGSWVLAWVVSGTPMILALGKWQLGVILLLAATGAAVYYDAKRLVGAERDELRLSPGAAALFAALMFPVGYPYYCWKRQRFTKRAILAWALVVTIIVSATQWAMGGAILSAHAEFQRGLNESRKQLEELQRRMP